MSLSSIEMTNAHEIPELDRKGLRDFGLSTGAAIVVIFGVVFPWILDLNWPVWPWVFAAPIWVLALLQPLWLRLIYKGWMRFGLLAGRMMTPLVLGIVFFVMISPMAMIRRLFGSDPLHRTFEPDKDSYRVNSVKRPREKLERPF